MSLSAETLALLERAREGVPVEAARRELIRRAVLSRVGAVGVTASAPAAAAGASKAVVVSFALCAVGATIGAAMLVREAPVRAPVVAPAITVHAPFVGSPPPPGVTSAAPAAASAAQQPAHLDSSAQPVQASAPPARKAHIDAHWSAPVRAAREATRQGSVGEATRQGSVGEATRQGSVGEATRQGSVGEATRQGSSNERVASGGPTASEHASVALAPSAQDLASHGAAGIEVSRPLSLSPSTLAEETALLRRAHDLLVRGDPREALVLLNEHLARFPTSVLEPERTTEQVLALCASARPTEARTAAAAFLQRHPGTLPARVRASCAGRSEP